MTTVTVYSLDDVTALVAALPLEAQLAATVVDVFEDGELTGHAITVPDEYGALAEQLAQDVIGLLKRALSNHVIYIKLIKEAAPISVMLGGTPATIATGDLELTSLLRAKVLIDAGLRQDDSAFECNGAGICIATNAELTAALRTALLHRQACLDFAAQMLDYVETGSITTRQQIENAAWPVPA